MWHSLSSSVLKHVHMLMWTQLNIGKYATAKTEGGAKIAKQPQLQITNRDGVAKSLTSSLGPRPKQPQHGSLPVSRAGKEGLVI